MVPIPSFPDWEAFNAHLEEQCANGRAMSCAATRPASANGCKPIWQQHGTTQQGNRA